MKIGNREFETDKHTYIMGILNVTPDSFSDGGSWNSVDKALAHTEQMLKEGADIIDIGGESTRPGYTMISDEEEIERVIPVIEAIKDRFDAVMSVDTYKSGVAEAAVAAGAHLINDIWGFKYDEKMADVAAKTGAAVCLMHNRKEAVYEDFLIDYKRDILESVDIALKAGVKSDRIILDPGVGFAKDYHQNLLCMKDLDNLCKLPYPVLLGTSRKSMIGNCLNLPSDQRVEGTLVTSVMAVEAGCAFVRVHDVEANRRAIMMAEAIKNA